MLSTSRNIIMAETFIEMKDIKGVMNTVDPTRIPGDYLAVGTNIDIDDEFMVKMARGHVKIISGNCHSLWSNKDKTFGLFVNGGALKMLHQDLVTVTTLLSGLYVGSPMCYTEGGGLIFFSNREVIGCIRDGIAYPFPTIDQPFKKRMVGGHILEYFNSRLYAAGSEIIAYSDAASPFMMDERDNAIQLTGQITMMKAIADGMYVSHGNTVAFLSGLSPSEFKYIPVNDSPAIPGMSMTVEGEEVAKGIMGRVAIWWAEDGCFIGLPEGQVKNLTKGYFTLEDVEGGALIYRDDLGFGQFLGAYKAKL